MLTGLSWRLLQSADEGTVDFSKLKVENLKKCLSGRGIQLSDGGKEGEKLSRNAAARKQPKLVEVVESYDHLLAE